ncbi:MAG: class I SAM-dependent methyltransferase [Acidobacteria bacterium]|nr:class I SAM-dependent methyltransferase [Acidobacteriota bacterium]
MPSSTARIAKWNARYAALKPAAEPDPSPLLTAAVEGLEPGQALDLACGAGRHAVWLAARGWRVTAVDGAPAALERLRARAAEAGCRDRIEPYLADLEAEPPEFTIAAAAYDLIVDCQFLHRPLFQRIRAGLRPGGLFVAALHIPAGDGARGHGYVLERGELARLAIGWGWTVLHGAERDAPAASDHGLGVAEIVARRPAVAPPPKSG